MTIRAIGLALAIVGVPTAAAHAERAGVLHTLNAVDGQAYAMRALCPTRGAVKFEVLTLGLVPEVEDSNSNCTFGRIGFEFVAPYTAQFLARYTTSVPIKDTKFVIEPDCAGSPATTCGVRADIINPVVGRITYPGDEDWIRLANSAYWNLKLTPTTTAGCFVTARVIEATANDYYARYVVVTGGPSGCGYTLTVGFRGF